MCQAYQAEHNFIVAGEDFATLLGFAAHRHGLKLTDNPNHSGYYHEAWAHGWNCRNLGIIPWCIERKFREQQRKVTGQNCYDKPTLEQADALT